ncbi:MAG: hypothetical protein ACMG6H_13640 [Acidobacteriota bacterium]
MNFRQRRQGSASADPRAGIVGAHTVYDGAICASAVGIQAALEWLREGTSHSRSFAIGTRTSTAHSRLSWQYRSLHLVTMDFFSDDTSAARLAATLGKRIAGGGYLILAGVE